MRDKFVAEDRSRGIFFDQDWGQMPGVLPVASGGIHVWHMPALVAIFGDDACLQFGGGTLGHPWGNAAGAAANRVAVEVCVKARNEGRELEKEGKDILTAAAQHSPELKIAHGDMERDQVRVRHRRQTGCRPPLIRQRTR